MEQAPKFLVMAIGGAPNGAVVAITDTLEQAVAIAKNQRRPSWVDEITPRKVWHNGKRNRNRRPGAQYKLHLDSL